MREGGVPSLLKNKGVKQSGRPLNTHLDHTPPLFFFFSRVSSYVVTLKKNPRRKNGAARPSFTLNSESLMQPQFRYYSTYMNTYIHTYGAAQK